VKKQKNAPARLIADLLELFGCAGSREQQTCAAGAGRSNDKPSLVCGKGGVFDDAKTESIGEKRQSLVVFAAEKGDVGESLRHREQIILIQAEWRAFEPDEVNDPLFRFEMKGRTVWCLHRKPSATAGYNSCILRSAEAVS